MAHHPWYVLGQLLACLAAMAGMLALLVRGYRDHLRRPPREPDMRSHRVGTPPQDRPVGSPRSPYMREGWR